MKKQTIAVVGLWHLGEIFSAGLAELGHTVIGIDRDAAAVAGLNRGIPPLKEPKLGPMLQKNIKAGRLSFSTSLEEIKKCGVIWIAFDIPVTEQDEADLTVLWDFFAQASPFLRHNELVAVSSQVPVGTCRRIRERLRELRPDAQFDIAYVPENLQLGVAIKSFFKPKRIVVGAEKKSVMGKIAEIFSPLKTKMLAMNTASAELSKHALNAFLATSLCFIYDIADVAKSYGADVTEVARALRSDERIGQQAYLDASIGFSGGTLARDIRTLIKVADEAHKQLPVIAGVWEKNKQQRKLAAAYLTESLGGLKGKKIAVLGLAYKPGTSTLRRAISLEIIAELLAAGAVVRVHDPAANPEEALRAAPVEFFADPYACVADCCALLIATNWPVFKTLNFKRLKSRMAQPSVFFDTRNFFCAEEERIKRAGFLYMGIGR